MVRPMGDVLKSASRNGHRCDGDLCPRPNESDVFPWAPDTFVRRLDRPGVDEGKNVVGPEPDEMADVCRLEPAVGHEAFDRPRPTSQSRLPHRLSTWLGRLGDRMPPSLHSACCAAFPVRRRSAMTSGQRGRAVPPTEGDEVPSDPNGGSPGARRSRTPRARVPGTRSWRRCEGCRETRYAR
jgi:hypothetical protein